MSILVTVTSPEPCEWCGAPFQRPHLRGPAPRFCSHAHRQRAHEARRASEVAVRDEIAEHSLKTANEVIQALVESSSDLVARMVSSDLASAAGVLDGISNSAEFDAAASGAAALARSAVVDAAKLSASTTAAAAFDATKFAGIGRLASVDAAVAKFAGLDTAVRALAKFAGAGGEFSAAASLAAVSDAGKLSGATTAAAALTKVVAFDATKFAGMGRLAGVDAAVARISEFNNAKFAGLDTAVSALAKLAGAAGEFSLARAPVVDAGKLSASFTAATAFDATKFAGIGRLAGVDAAFARISELNTAKFAGLDTAASTFAKIAGASNCASMHGLVAATTTAHSLMDPLSVVGQLSGALRDGGSRSELRGLTSGDAIQRSRDLLGLDFRHILDDLGVSRLKVQQATLIQSEAQRSLRFDSAALLGNSVLIDRLGRTGVDIASSARSLIDPEITALAADHDLGDAMAMIGDLERSVSAVRSVASPVFLASLATTLVGVVLCSGFGAGLANAAVFAVGEAVDSALFILQGSDALYSSLPEVRGLVLLLTIAAAARSLKDR